MIVNMKIKDKLKELFTWTPQEEYSFTIPDEGELQINSNSPHNEDNFSTDTQSLNTDSKSEGSMQNDDTLLSSHY